MYKLISKLLVHTSVYLACMFTFSGVLKAQETTQAEANANTEASTQVKDEVVATESKTEERDSKFTIKQAFSHTLESNLKSGSPGKVSISRAKTDIGYKTDVWEDGTLKVNFDYEYSDYDFSSSAFSPFNGTNIFGLKTKYIHKIDEEWGVFGSLKSTWAYERNKESLSDSQYFTANGGASYALNEDIKFYLGVNFTERFEDSNRFRPLIGVSWKIDEHWKLKVMNGLTVFYDLSADKITVFDFGVRYDWRQYRMRDNSLITGRNSAVTEEVLVGFAGLTHKFNEHLSVRGFVEYNDTREFEGRSDGHEVGDFDAKPTATIGLALNLGF